jgi:hypothetical protein
MKMKQQSSSSSGQFSLIDIEEWPTHCEVMNTLRLKILSNQKVIINEDTQLISAIISHGGVLETFI